MIMRGQEIYSGQDEATTSPSSSEREEEKRGSLLGRPWQYDRKIIYNGLSNEITLTHLGTKFALHPQTPSHVAKYQLSMIDKRKNHFATKGDIKRALILTQSFYLLL